MASAWTVLCVSIAFALVDAWLPNAGAAARCPVKPLGVSEGGGTFYATAFVRPFSTDRDAVEDAKKDAVLASKSLLKRDGRIPLGKNGVLYGAKQDSFCYAHGRIYATTAISQESARQAIKISEQISSSIGNNNHLRLESYSRAYDFEK